MCLTFALLSFLLDAHSVFQRTRRFVRANQMRVLSSLIILVILTLCIILAAVHLQSHTGKHHVRGDPWGTEPFIAPHGHSGTHQFPFPPPSPTPTTINGGEEDL